VKFAVSAVVLALLQTGPVLAKMVVLHADSTFDTIATFTIAEGDMAVGMYETETHLRLEMSRHIKTEDYRTCVKLSKTETAVACSIPVFSDSTCLQRWGTLRASDSLPTVWFYLPDGGVWTALPRTGDMQEISTSYLGISVWGWVLLDEAKKMRLLQPSGAAYEKSDAP